MSSESEAHTEFLESSYTVAFKHCICTSLKISWCLYLEHLSYWKHIHVLFPEVSS